MKVFNPQVERFIADGKAYNYLVVMCDTFDWEDYPHYCNTEKEALDYKDANHKINMQKCMDIINLKTREVVWGVSK